MEDERGEGGVEWDNSLSLSYTAICIYIILVQNHELHIETSKIDSTNIPQTILKCK